MEYQWRTLGVVSAGTLMAAIDTTVVVIAFPHIAEDLHASLVSMVWVLMVYILMGTALVLSLGRVADMKGRKRLYSAGFVVFVVGSALCALSQNAAELIGFRALQGVGAAMLFANSFALLSDAFPATERGRAFGLNTVIWGAGAIGGIVLGALILSVADWRWIFWVNVPIGIVGTALALLLLRESVTPNPRETFDFPAAGMFTAALAAILFGITEGILNGWSAPIALIPLLVSVPLLLGFVLWELYMSRDPILPLALFRNWLFSASLLSSMLQGVALFAANFLLMVYYQGILGIPVLNAAAILAPFSIALVVVSFFGGRLSDRFGARIVSTVGLIAQAAALLLFSTIDAATPLAQVGVYEALLGVGGGLFFPANTAAIMGSVPRARFGVASGVMMTLRNSATALSYAVAMIAVTSALPLALSAQLVGGSFSASDLAGAGLTPAQVESSFLSGMTIAFRLSAGLVLAAAAFSVLRGRERRIETGRWVHHPSTVAPFVYDPPPRTAPTPESAAPASHGEPSPAGRPV